MSKERPVDKLDEYIEVIAGLDVVTCLLPKNFNRSVLERLCGLLTSDTSGTSRAVCRRLSRRSGVMILRAVSDRAYHSAWYGDLVELVDLAIEGGAGSLEFV